MSEQVVIWSMNLMKIINVIMYAVSSHFESQSWFRFGSQFENLNSDKFK